MNRYYIETTPEVIAYRSKESYSLEDFENIRNNYRTELDALRKRYLDKMIQCAANIRCS